jgi:hypothetical protein
MYLVWKATTLDQPSLSKCRRSSAGESGQRISDVSWFQHPELTSETNVVIVHQPVDGLDLSANIVFLRLVEQVLYGRMLLVTSKDLLGLFLPASRSVTLSVYDSTP